MAVRSDVGWPSLDVPMYLFLHVSRWVFVYYFSTEALASQVAQTAHTHTHTVSITTVPPLRSVFDQLISSFMYLDSLLWHRKEKPVAGDYKRLGDTTSIMVSQHRRKVWQTGALLFTTTTILMRDGGENQFRYESPFLCALIHSPKSIFYF